MDLIDRQAAMIAVTAGSISTATVFGRTEEGMTAAKEIIRAIKSIPSAQPELIRCKDCENWERMNKKQGACEIWSDIEDGMTRYTDELGFCSYAERRTDEGD